MSTDKKTETANQQPRSPDPRAGATKKENRELTEKEQERVQGGLGDGSVRSNRV
jgi:hypothetical protein